MADINDRALDVSITDDNQTKKVSVITDGILERLAVDANVSGGVTLQRFTSKIQYSVANTSLSTISDTTLFTITANAQMDFININASLSTYEVVLVIDGVEELRINMADLGSTLGLSSATAIPIAVEIANKNFKYIPKTPVDFLTSFVVKARAISGSPIVNWLVMYREVA